MTAFESVASDCTNTNDVIDRAAQLPATSIAEKAHTTYRPTVQWRERPLHPVASEMLKAIARTNNPPSVFQRDGRLVRIRRTEFGIRIEELNFDSLRHHLDQCVTFIVTRESKKADGSGKVVEGPPPLEFVRDLLVMPEWPTDAFPVLVGIAEQPYFRKDGTLVDQRGYDAATRLWYEPAEGMEGIRVPSQPTDEDVAKARDLIVNDFLGDFPFAEPVDRANAVAFLVTAFLLEVIESPVPLLIADAPVQGTGKTLLLMVLSLIVTGRPVAALPESKGEDELRKVILAALMECKAWILLDNLTGTLRATALATVLTTRHYEDRELGKTKLITVINRSIWSASANNLQVDGDLARRVVWCRLDAKMEYPDQRSRESFQHPDIMCWAKQQRIQVVTAILTLIRAWVVRGRPPGKMTMGSFESWAATLGGILDVAKIDGFLTNAEEKRRARNEDEGQWRAMCHEWWNDFQDGPVGVKDLFELVCAREHLPWILTAPNERGQRLRLGRALAKAEGRCFGDYRICLVDQDRSNRKRYRLECISKESVTGPGDDYEIPPGLPPGTTVDDVLNAGLTYCYDEASRPQRAERHTASSDKQEIRGDYVTDEEFAALARRRDW